MIFFERIVNKTYHYLQNFRSLYEGTFPLHERRNWGALLQIIYEPKCYVTAIISNQQFAGFVIYWKFGHWVYIEHLAVEPACRGQQIGSQAVHHVMHPGNKKLILELEFPACANDFKRIQFYEKLGLSKVDHQYFQPPYRKDERPLAMMLMCSSILTKKEYDSIVKQIRMNVYEQFY